jgi:hypothetical protein
LAIEAARLGAATGSDELLQLAERSAAAANELVAVLPGHATWGPQANAALVMVALARGDVATAVPIAMATIQALQAAGHEDGLLEIVVPLARAIFAGGPPEVRDFALRYLRLMLARIAQGTLDEQMRVRWLKGPLGRQLVELAGPLEVPAAPTRAGAFDGAGIDDVDRALLRLLTEGHTNAEMAAKVGLAVEEVGVRLAKLLVGLGVSNRAEATTLAFKGFAR